MKNFIDNFNGGLVENRNIFNKKFFLDHSIFFRVGLNQIAGATINFRSQQLAFYHKNSSIEQEECIIRLMLMRDFSIKLLPLEFENRMCVPIGQVQFFITYWQIGSNLQKSNPLLWMPCVLRWRMDLHIFLNEVHYGLFEKNCNFFMNGA